MANTQNDLVAAVKSGDLAGAKEAIANGADPNEANPFGQTPFNYAIKSGNLAMVQMLIEGGADVNPPIDDMGVAPLSYAEVLGNEEVVSILKQAGARHVVDSAASSSESTDALDFKDDFGKGGYNEPCSGSNPCNGDFECDGDCDGTDAALFKRDFGRGGYNNPCPACPLTNPWCDYTK